MPSKKKARGKGPRAAKSRKAREGGAANNNIDSEMQRLQITNIKNTSKQEDDAALLEAAINLAATEREELGAAAKNDGVNNSKICNHGFVSFPRNHVCVAFFKSFVYEYNAICKFNLPIGDVFKHAYEATKKKFAEVWNDPDKIQRAASHFINYGVNKIVEGNFQASRLCAMSSSFFDQWAAEAMYHNETQGSCKWYIFDALCDWTMMSELHEGDEHTLVSFFRKRIPCKCLDSKYEEVKSIKKIGFCHNPDCSIPGNKTIRSKMLYCTQCRNANYCSRECQESHWPRHKKICAVAANMRAARKSRQKSR